MSNLSFNMTYGRQEQGAALIAVLLILILIIIVGVVALRKSTTDLRVATADQMDNALLQSSESGYQKLEAIVNGPTTGANAQLYRNIVLNTSGAFGHFISATNNNNNRGDEFVYCYNPDSNYLRSQATIFRQGGRMGGTAGFCETNGDYTYATGRETVTTQMSVVLPDLSGVQSENERAFTHRVTATGELAKESYEFDIYASSAIPSYGNPDGCFANSSVPSSGSNTSPLMDCLTNAQTPHKVIYQQAVVAKEVRLSTR